MGGYGEVEQVGVCVGGGGGRRDTYRQKDS